MTSASLRFALPPPARSAFRGQEHRLRGQTREQHPWTLEHSAAPLGVATARPQARPWRLPEKVQWTPKPTRDQAASPRTPGCVRVCTCMCACVHVRVCTAHVLHARTRECVCMGAGVHTCVSACMCIVYTCGCVCMYVMQIREWPPYPMILPFLTMCTQVGDRKFGCRPCGPGWSGPVSFPPPMSCPPCTMEDRLLSDTRDVHVPSGSRSTPFWGESCGEAPPSPWGTPSAFSI